MLLIKTSRRRDPSELIAEVLVPAAVEAREAATRAAETTLEWAAPHVEAAKEWAGPRVEPVLGEAKLRGTAAVAALRGEVDPPRKPKRRLRKLLVLAAVAVAAIAVWKALSARSDEVELSPWATPVPDAGAGGPDVIRIPDDSAGASPDEALADAAEELAAAQEKANTSPGNT